jgi:hypothetical protein
VELLFLQGELDASLRATRQRLLDEIHRWDPDQLLMQSESEVAAYLAAKHSAHCPRLKREEMYADEPADIRQRVVGHFDRVVEVPATRLVVHVPYEGEQVFFSLKPNRSPTALRGLTSASRRSS